MDALNWHALDRLVMDALNWRALIALQWIGMHLNEFNKN